MCLFTRSTPHSAGVRSPGGAGSWVGLIGGAIGGAVLEEAGSRHMGG